MMKIISFTIKGTGKIIKEFDPIPEGFIIPRTGEVVIFDIKKEIWLVSGVSYCYNISKVVIDLIPQR